MCWTRVNVIVSFFIFTIIIITICSAILAPWESNLVRHLMPFTNCIKPHRKPPTHHSLLPSTTTHQWWELFRGLWVWGCNNLKLCFGENYPHLSLKLPSLRTPSIELLEVSWTCFNSIIRRMRLSGILVAFLCQGLLVELSKGPHGEKNYNKLLLALNIGCLLLPPVFCVGQSLCAELFKIFSLGLLFQLMW